MVKYPNGKAQKVTPAIQENGKINTRGRGMTLEAMINESNEYYLAIDRAIIHKKPTPVQVVKVDYPKRSAAKITEAYFRTPSTTDYNGLYKGKYIDFEAKECALASFSFQRIHPHQIEHLDACQRNGGICFLIIAFTRYDEVYLVDASYIIDRYRHQARQSLTYEMIKENGKLIPWSYHPVLDYLSIVENYYFKED